MRTEPTRQAAPFARACRLAFVLLLPLGLAGLTAASAASKPVEVHLSEYSIEMPMTLPAGPTTFNLHNDGVKKHRFKLEGPGMGEDSPATPVLSHETATFQVTLQPGEYKVYCPLGNHSAKGMTMTLKVTPK